MLTLWQSEHLMQLWLHALTILDPRVWTRGLRFKTIQSPMKSKLNKEDPLRVSKQTLERALSSPSRTIWPTAIRDPESPYRLWPCPASSAHYHRHGTARPAKKIPRSRSAEYRYDRTVVLISMYCVERLFKQRCRRVHTFPVRSIPSAASGLTASSRAQQTIVLRSPF